MKKILVFASGTKDGGGSGFLEMIERSKTIPKILNAEIVAVVSNYKNGGVWEKATKHQIPFIYFPGPYTSENYQKILKENGADFVMCSGWLKKVYGLPEDKTINIHPGPLPKFGGKGMYGHYVHEAVMAAYHRGEITQTAVTMHFVDENYDEGPIIAKIPVLIREKDTPLTLAERVLKVEHNYQSIILNEILEGKIFLLPGRKVGFKNSTFPTSEENHLLF